MDKQWNELVRKIIDTGYTQEEEDANTYYKDGEKATTLFTIGETFTFDGSKAAILTGKKINIKKPIGEILWIYQDKTNDLQLLKNKYSIGFWDDWDIGDGTIGEAYGRVVSNKYRLVKNPKDLHMVSDHAKVYADMRHDVETINDIASNEDRLQQKWMDITGKKMKREDLSKIVDMVHFVMRDEKSTLDHVPLDQMDHLLYGLYHNKFSRRHIITLYDPSIVDSGGLPPCVWNNMWYVTPDNKLNLEVTTRSSDLALGNPFNTIQYHVLQHMIAHVLGYEVGQFRFHMGNPHIYNRHVKGCEEIISREDKGLNPTIELKHRDNFYDFTVGDVTLKNYEPHPFVKFDIAVHEDPTKPACETD